MGAGAGAAGAGTGQEAEGGAADDWEPLSEDVRRTLEVLFDGDSDAQRGFRAQIPHAEMRRDCCSCPCVLLSVDADRVAAVPMEKGTDSVAGASLFNAQGGYDGEATVLASGGFLVDLQFCDWEDRGPDPLRLWEWLGPRHDTGRADTPQDAG
ncbi:hypothetical protein K7B10_18970 [Streptomyces flavotricini]|uniref:Uncharacterized protein n=1 Tax=Streptomyces flavotricini TaxID=66888 RepID=A0ABS8E812_9ACTN|nr:hypothetical protein [Streptomyces flavotricini]MCC0096834.1 hypothetical protein [Streptomyces flavotricini]